MQIIHAVDLSVSDGACPPHRSIFLDIYRQQIVIATVPAALRSGDEKETA
jgi:hypothetical protein